MSDSKPKLEFRTKSQAWNVLDNNGASHPKSRHAPKNFISMKAFIASFPKVEEAMKAPEMIEMTNKYTNSKNVYLVELAEWQWHNPEKAVEQFEKQRRSGQKIATKSEQVVINKESTKPEQVVIKKEVDTADKDYLDYLEFVEFKRFKQLKK